MSSTMTQTETEQRATVALRSLFSDASGDVAEVKPIRDRLSTATFHNYVSQANSARFVEVIKDNPTDKRLTSKLKLTDAGKIALGVATGKPTIITKKTADSGDIITLDESTKVTDAFNRQSKTWKWVLVRKDTPMS